MPVPVLQELPVWTGGMFLQLRGRPIPVPLHLQVLQLMTAGSEPWAERMVDLAGVEPATSSMPLKRAPNCATGPRFLALPN